jgi:hypothetical protein
MSHTMKVALAAAMVLGVASVAQASSKDDDVPSTGGYRVGPLGQSFGGANSVYHPSMRGHGAEAYGYQHSNEKNAR